MNKTRRTIKRETLVVLALLSFAVVDAAAAQDAQSACQPAPGRLVLISIADRQLAVIDGGNVIARFAVAVGAGDSPSPVGQFRIVNQSNLLPPGIGDPQRQRQSHRNAVGGAQPKRLRHSWDACAISIGQAASHGCIRLRNRDMERLFTLLRISDVVEIHGERDEQVAQVFGGIANPTMVADAQG
jgi:hypothetical protein